MIRNSINGIICALLLVFAIGCGGSESDQAAQEEQAPEPTTDAGYVEQATFVSLDGDTLSVDQFEGKVVMIDFWETWCKPCLASFPTMQKLTEEYPDDFVVLAVTPGFTDTKEDARAFAEENDYTFQYAMDTNKLHQKLGVQGIPFKVYVDADGSFIKKSMGSLGPDEDYKRLKEIIEEHKDS